MISPAFEPMSDGPLISVAGLCREYVVASEVVRALGGLDFEIGPHEYIAIMGPFGSGKSIRDVGPGAGPRAQQGDRIRLPDIHSPLSRNGPA